jgi:hypothetical protein
MARINIKFKQGKDLSANNTIKSEAQTTSFALEMKIPPYRQLTEDAGISHDVT